MQLRLCQETVVGPLGKVDEMSLVFWDTNLFVYWLQNHPEFGPQVGRIRERMIDRGDRLCTSTMTLGELLAAPYSGNDQRTVAQYKATLSPPHVEVVGFDAEAADIYAQIRGNKSITPPDAIQLACAARRRVDLFLTNDHRLTKIVVPGIQFIGGLDINIL